MRAAVMGVLGLAIGCTSPDGAKAKKSAPQTDDGTEASAAPKASAAPTSSAGPAPAATAAVWIGARDADDALRRIAPFDAAITDLAVLEQRLADALAICAAPFLGAAPWGKDDPRWGLARCASADHAKLLLMSAARPGVAADVAESRIYLGLALDPAAVLPPHAGTLPAAALAAAKRRPVAKVRVGAVSSTDRPTADALSKSLRGELAAGVRHCYASALLKNPELQGTVLLEAEIAADGRLAESKVSGSLPDSSVTRCIGDVANRTKVTAPSKTPTRLNVPFGCSAGAGG